MYVWFVRQVRPLISFFLVSLCLNHLSTVCWLCPVTVESSRNKKGETRNILPKQNWQLNWFRAVVYLQSDCNNSTAHCSTSTLAPSTKADTLQPLDTLHQLLVEVRVVVCKMGIVQKLTGVVLEAIPLVEEEVNGWYIDYLSLLGLVFYHVQATRRQGTGEVDK